MRVKKIQLKLLRSLLDKASETEMGQSYQLAKITSYPEFKRRLPIQQYSDIEARVERLKKGASDIFWPGSFNMFSVSAGTTSEGKHLPLSDQRLASDKRFIRKVAFSYFRQRPSIAPLLGKHISLPGSLERKKKEGRILKLGEISGFLGELTPGVLRWNQLIAPEQLLSMSFSEKFDQILHKSIEADIRVITAVPSWILILFQQVLEKTGKRSIGQVWPNLKLMICGGVKLSHYRSHLQALCGSLTPDMIETYGASEGYFSYTDDLTDESMKLVLDNGIFYEWIPFNERDRSVDNESILSTWQVDTGVPYEMVVTTNAGLWRYRVGDVIEFTNLAPPKIKVKGRTQDVLDTFGEAVYGWEAESALTESAEELNISFNQFSIGAKLPDENQIPRHYWFILFQESLTVNQEVLNRMAKIIDRRLQSINRHYAIRRESNALNSPLIFKVDPSIINNWLDKRNRNGLQVQSKMPRILQNQRDVDLMLDLLGNS